MICAASDELQDPLLAISRAGTAGFGQTVDGLDYEKVDVWLHIEGSAKASGAASSLHTLRVLTVSDGDDPEHEIDSNAATQIWISSAMQNLASQYLDVASQITAWSICQPRGNRFFVLCLPENPSFYCRAQVMKPYGKKEAIALEMSKEEVMYGEPASEILDLDINGWRALRYGYRR